MSAEETALHGVIDMMWEIYDQDKKGVLNKDQTKKFVMDTIGELGVGDEFSEVNFDTVYATISKGPNETVNKQDMTLWFKRVLGGGK